MKTYATVLFAILLALLSVLSYAQAPVPFINLPLLPDATAPRGPQFTLTVNGTGFVSSSVVNWNGSALATQFVTASHLTATVPAADIATGSTASVTVVNPAPGGGTSNVAFFTVTASTPNFVKFDLASGTGVGNWPWSVAVGDFNGDGKLDLAVGNANDNSVSILLGDGTGNFTLASSPAAGGNSYSVAVGDFNGDGKLDLAVANNGSNTVSILLGDGAGNFTLASSPVVGVNPQSVAVGDFNGDGKLDLAAANSGSNTISILLGDGTGNFTLATSPVVGNNPDSVAVSDFNGDGKLDLAVANYGYWGSDSGVSILLGDGTGNFTSASSLGAGVNSQSLVVGDFNGDGKLDLAVVNVDIEGTVSILLGDGTGNFTLAHSVYVGNNPGSLAMGDFNGDSKLDLVTVNMGNSTVAVLLGDGTGNFGWVELWAHSLPPYSVAVGDFNGDGKLDLALANYTYNALSILLSAPPGPVELSPASLTFGAQPVGTSSNPLPVTLTNIGVAALDITRVVTSANFSQTNNCPRQIPPGGTCTANVVFTPHGINTITGTITITDNAPTSPQTVSLTGVGTLVTLVPSSLNFGDQLVGTTSAPQAVIFTNYGQRSVSIDGGYFTGSDAGAFAQTNTCGTSLPAGGSCTISVTFTPKATRGPKAATLVVVDNGGASPQKVSLTGLGTVVTLSPTTLNFGNQTVGTTSQPQIVTLTNQATERLKIIRIQTEGPGRSNFAPTSDCGTWVPGGGSCTISVTFTPARIGSETVPLAVYSNGNGRYNSHLGPQTVTLSGTGTN